MPSQQLLRGRIYGSDGRPLTFSLGLNWQGLSKAQADDRLLTVNYQGTVALRDPKTIVNSDPDALHRSITNEIRVLSEVTPANGDLFVVEDSSANYKKRKVDWADIVDTALLSSTLQLAYDGGGAGLGRTIDFTDASGAPVYLYSENLTAAFMLYINWVASGTLGSNPAGQVIQNSKRTHTGTTTVNDDWVNNEVTRESIMNNASGTFNVTGTVIYRRIKNTQTAGTLADTTDLYQWSVPAAGGTWTGKLLRAFYGTGVTTPFFQIDTGGAISWGTGSGAVDVTLSRAASNTLQAQALILTRGLIVNSDAGTSSLQVKGLSNDHTLYTAATTNRVGVGTSTPDTSLHVTGPHVTGTGTFLVKNSADHAYMTLDHGTAVSPGKNGGLYFKQAGTAKWLIDHVQINDYLRFYDYGGPGEMIISLAGTGNIGFPHGTIPSKTTNPPASEIDLYDGRISQMGWHRIAAASDQNTTKEVIVGVTALPRTITLDTDDVVSGRIIVIKDEVGNALTSNITVATEGSQTIDGAASLTIAEDYGYAKLYSDGSNWFIIGRSPTAGAP